MNDLEKFCGISIGAGIASTVCGLSSSAVGNKLINIAKNKKSGMQLSLLLAGKTMSGLGKVAKTSGLASMALGSILLAANIRSNTTGFHF